MPSDSGVTSSSRTSLTSPFSTPAWIAAPIATTSSGLTLRLGSLPKNCLTVSMTLGMRVMPPTRITSSISEALSPASFSALRHGPIVRWIRSSTSASSLARVSLMLRCLGPCWSAVMNGRLTSVCIDDDSSILAFSAASFSRCKREPVVAQVDPLLFFELVGEIVDDVLVEVLAAEERVAIGRFDLEHAVADLEHRDVEGAAAEIVDRDRAAALALHAVGERRRGRLVDDAQHFEPGDLAGVLGRLALAVVEIGRHGDDRLGHRLAEIGLGGFLHLLQDEGADLRRRVFLAAALDPGVAIVARDDLVGDEIDVLLDHRVGEAPADQPLDRKERVLGIGHGLAFRRLADEAFARLGERHHRGRGAHALAVLDHLGVPAFHHGDAGIGRAEIDTDDLAHGHLIVKSRTGRPGEAPSRSPGKWLVSHPLTLQGYICQRSERYNGSAGFARGSPGCFATPTMAGRSRRSCST